ncbi:MAG TPA: hypothetical protein VF918_00160 [Anaerolineales bacterium]
MVIEKKILTTTLARYRLGTVLIWLGIMTWVPFIILRMAGEKPSLFWYLPFHLIGVIGGSRLRATARKEMDLPPRKMSLLRMIAHGLIYAGISVWVPYFYLKATTLAPVDVMNFLPYHLTGVFSGIILLVINFWMTRKENGTRQEVD